MMNTLPHELLGVILGFVPHVYMQYAGRVARIWNEYARQYPHLSFSGTVKELILQGDCHMLSTVTGTDQSELIEALKMTDSYAVFAGLIACNKPLATRLIDCAITELDEDTIREMDISGAVFSLQHMVKINRAQLEAKKNTKCLIFADMWTAQQNRQQNIALNNAIIASTIAKNPKEQEEQDRVDQMHHNLWIKLLELQKIICKNWAVPSTEALVELSNYPPTDHTFVIISAILGGNEGQFKRAKVFNINELAVLAQCTHPEFINGGGLVAIESRHVEDVIELLKRGAFTILVNLSRELIIALNMRICLTEALELIPQEITMQNLAWLIICFRGGENDLINKVDIKLRKEVLLAAKLAGRGDLKEMINTIFFSGMTVINRNVNRDA